MNEAFYDALRPWGSDPLAAAAQQQAKRRKYVDIFGSDDD